MFLQRLRNRSGIERSRAQALIELALVMPVLVGIIAVLFQYGIVFIVYFGLVQETRDIGRWLAVHADTVDCDTLDQATCSTAGNASVQTIVRYVNANKPTLMMPSCSTAPCVRLSSVDPSSTNATDKANFAALQNATPGVLWVYVTPTCATMTAGHCTNRPPGVAQRVTLAYDARGNYFLPTDFRMGPWLRVAIPTTLPPYDYTVMVEPH